MAGNIAPISNPTIYVSPSEDLIKYIKNIEIHSGDEIPIGLKNIMFKNKPKESASDKKFATTKKRYFTSTDDKKFISSLNIKEDFAFKPRTAAKPTKTNSKLLSLQDIYWLYDYIQEQNVSSDDKKTYLHELMKGSEVILPQNESIPRNEELEKRCRKLKAEQETRNYHNMTKNVDTLRSRLPEDTIGFQLKQMNRQLLAVFQFVLSVIAGFAFGFLGVELIIGSLEFGFRLLLGIICSLTIAVAELYFLMKNLNQDMEFESLIDKQQRKPVKAD